MKNKSFIDRKIIRWLILALIIVPGMALMTILLVKSTISQEYSTSEAITYWVILLLLYILEMFVLRVYGEQTASMLMVSKNKIVWKNLTKKNVKLRIDECKYVGINDCTQLPKVSYAPSSSFFLRRGDELSLIYISDHPMPREYYHKLSADKCKDGFICFVYSDKLCNALIKVLPEEKTAVLKAFYERMQEADIRLAKEKEKYKRKKLREKEKQKKRKEKQE